MKKDNTTEMVEWQSSLGGMPSSLSRRDKGKIKKGPDTRVKKFLSPGPYFTLGKAWLPATEWKESGNILKRG